MRYKVYHLGRHRNLLILFVASILLLLPIERSYGQISLDSCHIKAKANYPLINQYQLIEQTKEFSLANAGKAYLPQLDVTLLGGVIDGLPSFAPPGASESDGTAFNMIAVLQLNQTIWDGGITKAKKGMIEANAEIEQADLDVALYALEDRVNNLYFGTLLIDEQIGQLLLLKATLERNKKKVEIAVENGTAFNSDVDEITVEVINAEQKISELHHNRLAYLSVLSAMIGEDLDPEQQLIRPASELPSQIIEMNRPELQLFQNKLKLLEAQAKIDKAAVLPKIGILGFGTFIQPGVDFGASTINNLLVAGISANWSLGSLYRNGNNKKLTEVNISKVKLQQETFLFNTNLALTQTRNELAKYESVLEQDRKILALKSSIKKSYEIKYDNGVSTMTALLNKVNEESMAKQTLNLHEIQYLMKQYQYKNQSGN